MAPEMETQAMSKEEIRQAIWTLMEERDIARPPRPVFGRIPNFEGAEVAAEKLASLPEFKRARVIKVNPDSPQMPVRLLALLDGKSVLMPSPRLREGFLLISPKLIPSFLIKKASTIKGAFRYGKKVRITEIPKIDLVVAGSVAVSPDGARIGKGGGYSEIEAAILRELGAIDDSTPIVTTVHDVQIVTSIPVEKHDVPVDIIVTSTKVIRTKSSHPKPPGVLWEIVTQEMIEKMPILEEVRLYTRAKPCSKEI